MRATQQAAHRVQYTIGTAQAEYFPLHSWQKRNLARQKEV
jgi:hypothetical protein